MIAAPRQVSDGPRLSEPEETHAIPSPALFAPRRNRLSVRAFSEISTSKGTTMDRENTNRVTEEHSQAENKLEKAEGAIRKALDELKDLSGHLKERIAGKKERPEFPVDDDPPGDTEEALRGPEER
jgi:hypothetical protein